MATENENMVTITTKILNTHDSPEKWEQDDVKDFVPAKGQFIVYDAPESAETNSSRVKVGNGRTAVSELPFLDATQTDISVQLGENQTLGGYKTGDTISAGTDIQTILSRLFQKSVPATYTFFVGTQEEYDTANANNEVAAGAIVILTDDEILAVSTTSKLGQAVLGQMILG